jgi:hypothetical protein
MFNHFTGSAFFLVDLFLHCFNIQASLNIYPSLFPQMQADSKNEEEDEKIEDERTFHRQNF